MALAYGVLLAGIVQLLFQIPFLAKIHAIPRPRWNPRHEGVRRIGKLMLPAIFGSSVAQVNVLVGGVIASMLGVGKISLLYYSDRLMEFPLGLFSIALATVTLPHLSRQHATASAEGFSRTVDWSMKLVFLIALPAAVGLVVLAEPLVATIFYGGEFSASDVRMTALSLQAFALGLLGFSLVKILAPAYFAREDTKTPVKVGLIALAINFVLSVTLAWALTRTGYEGTHAGLALATSVAAVANAWLLWRGLRRDGVVGVTRGWSVLLARLLLANAAMVVFLMQLSRPLAWWLESSLMHRSVWLGLTIAGGAIVYFLSLLLVGTRPAQLRLKSD
jgi:putative peptidoglycan lipid II flippase